jgi:hypothetical protein
MISNACVCDFVQNARQNYKFSNKFFKNVTELIYLGMTLKQNCTHEETESRFNSRNACYSLIQSLLSTICYKRNVSIEIYTTIVSPVVLYECEAGVAYLE